MTKKFHNSHKFLNTFYSLLQLSHHKPKKERFSPTESHYKKASRNTEKRPYRISLFIISYSTTYALCEVMPLRVANISGLCAFMPCPGILLSYTSVTGDYNYRGKFFQLFFIFFLFLN